MGTLRASPCSFPNRLRVPTPPSSRKAATPRNDRANPPGIDISPRIPPLPATPSKIRRIAVLSSPFPPSLPPARHTECPQQRSPPPPSLHPISPALPEKYPDAASIFPRHPTTSSRRP